MNWDYLINICILILPVFIEKSICYPQPNNLYQDYNNNAFLGADYLDPQAYEQVPEQQQPVNVENYYQPYIENQPELQQIPEKISELNEETEKHKRYRKYKHRNPKLSLAEWGSYNIPEPEGPGTYAWGYEIEDPVTGNVQFRSEEKHANGSVTGSYGYLDPEDNVHIVHYIADHLGYRATIENSRYKDHYEDSPSYENSNDQMSLEMMNALENQNNLNYGHQVLEQHQRPSSSSASSRRDVVEPLSRIIIPNNNLTPPNY